MSNFAQAAVGLLLALALIITVVLILQIRKRRRLAGQNEIVVFLLCRSGRAWSSFCRGSSHQRCSM